MEDEIADRKFNFTISEKCEILNLGNSDDVVFYVEDNLGKKLLTGFSITINNSTESVATFNAKQKALILSNFISVKYGKYIRSSLEGFSRVNHHGTLRVTKLIGMRWSHIRELKLDLKDKTTSSALNDTEKNILYEHASRGIKAAQDEDPVTMIREFYQVIEGKGIPNYLKKFKYLRHVLSHNGPIHGNTKRNLEQGFKKGYFRFSPKNAFDYTSPQNIERLNEQARCLMYHALKRL